MTVTRISTPGNDSSRAPSVSADGRFVAYASLADNLVEQDTNQKMDIFVFDRQDGRTECLTRQADGHSYNATISANGRFVAFVSQAENLVPGDNNGLEDVFVHDRQTGNTWRASVDGQGRQAEGRSGSPAISGDGRFVAFESVASNLVPGDDNAATDVFLRDNWLGETHWISRNGDADSTNPSLSGDGLRVAFQSDATNLVGSRGPGNFETDVYVFDRASGQTILVSQRPDGTPSNGRSTHPVLSGDGQRLAFETTATNLVGEGTRGMGDVLVADLGSRELQLGSVSTQGQSGDRASGDASLSHDGKTLAFSSFAGNLSSDGNDESDIFVRDLALGETRLVSHGAEDANGGSYLPRLSADGASVVFMSLADNLVSGDDNGTWDVYQAPARS